MTVGVPVLVDPVGLGRPGSADAATPRAPLEGLWADGDWAKPTDLERFAQLVVAASDMAIDRGTSVERPRLVIKVSDKHAIEVQNTGDDDAHEISIEPLDDETRAATTLADVAPGRLSPGATWRAGFHTASLGHPGPHVVRLAWKGSNGTAYDGEFPL